VPPLVVGVADDEHVEAVISVLGESGIQPLLIDAASLDAGTVSLPPWTPRGIDDGPEGRGWIRRLAPPEWRRASSLDSHDGVVRAAWATLLFGTLLSARCTWLTRLPELLTAENKLFQLCTARACGILVPHTVVATRMGHLTGFASSTVVVKPLGPSAYIDADGSDRVVAAQRVSMDDLDDALLADAPFLFQEELRAEAHLRIVTVGACAWVGRLSAEGLPLDWRLDDAAHDSFQPAPDLAAGVGETAVTLARAAGVGYSSQDWVQTVDGEFMFLDLNPAGQWLFLPDDVAKPVTRAIASYLSQRL
jgi:hypothetical protein